jgi:hypothetical protein
MTRLSVGKDNCAFRAPEYAAHELSAMFRQCSKGAEESVRVYTCRVT